MAGIGKYKGKGEFKMNGYSPYDGSSFKMKSITLQRTRKIPKKIGNLLIQVLITVRKS